MILAMMALSLAAQTGKAPAPQRARANLNQYFTTDDYPAAALARHAEGTVGFRIEIGADGTVTRCTVTQSSNDASLDAATCAILRDRAHYQPARDARGNAVAGRDEGRVTWRLPPPTRAPLVLTRTESRLHWDGNGLLTCTVLVNGTSVPNIGTSRCGPLAGGGIEQALRSAPSAADIVAIWVAGPADSAVETPLPDETALGTRAFNLVAALDVGEDGRITTCRITSRDILATLTLPRTPDICAFYPPGTPPVFAPATGPRQAKMRMTLYLGGSAVQIMSGQASPRP